MKKLLFVSCICFLFMIIEFAGGIWSGSLSILADAAHMFSDVAGFMISYVSIYIARKPSTFINGYGNHRAEIIGAILSVLFIWCLLIALNTEATIRIVHGVERFTPEGAHIMLITAIFGLMCNLLNLLALNCFCNPDAADGEDDIGHSSTVSSIKGYSTN